MRWENLFDDLESQLDSELTAEHSGELIEEERHRQSALTVRDRIRALCAPGAPAPLVRLVLVDGMSVSLAPTRCGLDWLAGDLVEQSERRSGCILPFAAIRAVQLDAENIRASLVPLPDESPSQLSARLPLPFVLRDLCRRRSWVGLRLSGGTLAGTIDRVGRDHLDLAIHDAGVARRESEISDYRIVRLSEIVLLRI